MKTAVIPLLLAVSCVFANAQTEKGRYLIGGNLRLSTGRTSADITITPTLGYFFIRNFVAGTALDFGYSRNGESPRVSRVTTFGVGPFFRYYIGESKLRPFVHGDVNFIHRESKFASEVPINSTGANYFVGPGLAIFLNHHVALEGFAGYQHVANTHHLGDGGFGLRIGFRFV